VAGSFLGVKRRGSYLFRRVIWVAEKLVDLVAEVKDTT
jgi:hypothetical protein